MSLPLRNLGTTGFRISPVGFGAWAVGGGNWAFGWGDQDDRQSIASIRRAIDHGVNWIDTAPVYGYGHSEEIVRLALADIPPSQRPYVFTKCGLEWNPDDRQARSRRVGDAKIIRRSVEESLKRLQVETLDVLFMHWPSADGTSLEAYWQALLDLKAEGKARAVGLSNHSAAQLKVAEQLGHVDVLQNPFSALQRQIGKEDLPWCADNGTGVVVYSPMQSGLLSGAFTRERAAALPAEDWRSKAPLFRGSDLEKSLAVADTLAEIGEAHGVAAGAVAIAWTLAWRGVSGAIVGARNTDQVDGWIAAATLELDTSEIERIADTIVRSGAGDGPTRPA